MAASLPLTPASATTNYPLCLNLRIRSNFVRLRSQRNIHFGAVSTSFRNPQINPSNFHSSAAKFPFGAQLKVRVNATAPSSKPETVASGRCRQWMVLIERPPEEIIQSREEITKYYVGILQTVLGSEGDPRNCVYDVSCDTHFGFCCDIDEETSQAIAGLPEVLLVRPDHDRNSGNKDYSASKAFLEGSRQSANGPTLLFPTGSSKHWLVRMDKPSIGVVTKAQMVDFFVETLTK